MKETKPPKRVTTSEFATVPLTKFGADLAFVGAGDAQSRLQTILVLVDFHNKHTKLMLLPNKQSETVFKAFHDYFSQFGLDNPAIGLSIYTDKGKEFSPPPGITYNYIKMLHPGDYLKHEVDYEDGIIKRRQRNASKTGNHVKESSEKITIHGHTFNYPVESQVWSFKSRLKKVFDELKIKTGKVKHQVTQDILDEIEESMNSSREYFISPDVVHEMLNPGLYSNKDKSDKDREEHSVSSVPAKFSVGEHVYVKTQKGYLEKKSMMHSWTPFTLEIVERRLVFGFWKYKVKDNVDLVDKWFYEDELKKK